MKCLCCGKEINQTDKGFKFNWHQKCIHNFFGTEQIPVVDVSRQGLKKILEKQLESKESITGVQKKFSLHLLKTASPRLTIVDQPAGYILKPQTDEYKNLPEIEFVSMQLARLCGINCVPFGLIKTNDENYAYITKRIDRVIINDEFKKLPMEDFCQLGERLTEDKYNGSYERCGSIINKYSDKVNFDLSELFLRVVFSYIIGNNDMHLKNFSLISYEKGVYSLSPAYDLLAVKLILKTDLDDLALTLHGKKRRQTKNDFFSFASAIGVNDIAAKKIINSIINKKEQMLDIINNSVLNDNLKKDYSKMISENIEKLA